MPAVKKIRIKEHGVEQAFIVVPAPDSDNDDSVSVHAVPAPKTSVPLGEPPLPPLPFLADVVAASAAAIAAAAGADPMAIAMDAGGSGEHIDDDDAPEAEETPAAAAAEAATAAEAPLNQLLQRLTAAPADATAAKVLPKFNLPEIKRLAQHFAILKRTTSSMKKKSVLFDAVWAAFKAAPLAAPVVVAVPNGAAQPMPADPHAEAWTKLLLDIGTMDKSTTVLHFAALRPYQHAAGITPVKNVGNVYPTETERRAALVSAYSAVKKFFESKPTVKEIDGSIGLTISKQLRTAIMIRFMGQTFLKDEHKVLYMRLGMPRTKFEIDAGETGLKSKFWKKIVPAFNDPDYDWELGTSLFEALSGHPSLCCNFSIDGLIQLGCRRSSIANLSKKMGWFHLLVTAMGSYRTRERLCTHGSLASSLFYPLQRSLPKSCMPSGRMCWRICGK